jgi:hypothetical protein
MLINPQEISCVGWVEQSENPTTAIVHVPHFHQIFVLTLASSAENNS